MMPKNGYILSIEYNEMMHKKLNLGCGTDYKQGWVNLDISPVVGADVVHDLEKLPLPFGDGGFSEIICHDILEHVEYIPLMNELYRVLAPNGRLTIRVPHFTSKNNFIDPTHKKLFSVQLFDFYVKGAGLHKRHGYQFNHLFSSIERNITFEKSGGRALFYNKHIERFINKTPYRQWYYESTFLRGLFPAENIIVTLVK